MRMQNFERYKTLVYDTFVYFWQGKPPHLHPDSPATGGLPPRMRNPFTSPAITVPPAPQEDTGASLARARAAYLHQSLPIATWGSGGVSALFTLLFWDQGYNEAMGVWAGLGLAAFALRIGLLLWFKPEEDGPRQWLKTHVFLWLGALAALLAGIMFGYGWVAIFPHLGPDERLAFVMGNVALLFGGLFTYSAHLPTYMAFSLSCLPLGIAEVFALGGPGGEWVGATVTFTLTGVLSLMFAYRSANAFSTNHLLQQREIKLLQEITAKRDEAVSATLAKSRFLASVSHDLRQPMHAINLYLTSLQGSYEQQQQNPADPAPATQVRASIQSLKESTLYLNAMFESLLDISRLDAGTVAANIRYTSLARMMAQLDADYQRLAQAEDLAFETKLPARFPVMEIETDPALLERLLRNLIVNAFRYTRQGGVRLRVSVSPRSVDIRVVDSGPGIDRSLRRRIFEEFFQIPGSQEQVARSSNTGRGIGLGLSISARLAQKLGTTIRVHGRLGRGSVFAVRLPMRHALRPVSEDPRDRVVDTPKALPPNTFVAVIDDDLEILRSTRMMLESAGATVFCAVSGTEAVQKLGQMGRRPDILISDFRLGAEDGISAINRVRDEFNDDVPALLITGDTSAELVSVFRESGLRVLHKPIAGETLLAAISHELDQGN